MTNTAVGAAMLGPTPTLVATINYTFPFTPTAVHSFSVWGLWITNSGTEVLDIGSVADTQGNSWMELLPSQLWTEVGAHGAIWGCISRTAAAATVTMTSAITTGGTVGTIGAQVRGKEFTNSSGLAGRWSKDSISQYDTQPSNATLTGFTTTTRRSGLVIYEIFEVFNVGTVGTTAGFAGQLDGNNNVYMWAVNSTGAAQTPTASQSPAGTYDRAVVSFGSDILGVPAPVGMGTM